MPQTCFINGCSSRGRSGGKSYFAIPAIIRHQGEQTMELSTRRRREWIAAINRKDEPTKHSAVCSDHFITGRAAKLYDTDNPDWVPSVFMCSTKRRSARSADSPSNKRKLERYQRVQKRLAVRKQLAGAKDLMFFATTAGIDSANVNPSQTSITSKKPACCFMKIGKLKSPKSEGWPCSGDNSTVCMLRGELQRHVDELHMLRGELQKHVDQHHHLQDALQKCDDKCNLLQGELQKRDAELNLLRDELQNHLDDINLQRSKLATTNYSEEYIDSSEKVMCYIGLPSAKV